MKTRATAALMFVLGVTAAWLVKSDDPTPPAIPAVERGARGERPRPRPTTKVQLAEEDKRRLDEIVQGGFGPGPGFGADQGQSGVLELDSGEYPRLLGALRERAGLTGLSWDEKEACDRLLRSWYNMEPIRAANWVRRLESNKDRMTFGGLLVMETMKVDYDQAVRMMQEFSVDENGVVRIPQQLMSKAAELGAAKLVDLLALSNSEGGGIGFATRFPDDFDFPRALDGIAALQDKGIHPASYPGFLLSEWAKRDPEPAIKWAAAGHGVPFGMNLGSYFQGLGSPEELVEALALIAATDKPAPQIYTDMAYALSVDHEENVEEVLSGLPADVDQLKVRGGLLGATSYQGDGLEPFREALLAELTPDERIMAVRTVLASTGEGAWNQDSRDSLTRTLIKLGHPQELMVALIPSAPASDEPTYGIVSSVSFGTGFVEEDPEPEEPGEESP